jgi:carbon starvation protein
MMSDESIKGLKPGTIYGNGLGEFISLLIGKEHLPFAITLGAMAFSTFVFDTLDVSARLGRYLFQELTGLKGRAGSLLGTFLIAALPLVVLLNMKSGSWGQYWTLFGASNQLLAALTLLSVSAWLYHSKRKIWFTLLPMFFVITITMWTLGQMIVGNWKQSQIWYDSAMLNSVAAMLLMLLALFINIKGFQQFRKRR